MSIFLKDDLYQKYLICDFETENLNIFSDNRPWSVSWILYQNSRILEQYDRFIWWDDLQISDGAAKITKFDRSEYKRRGEDPKLVLDDFEKDFLNEENIIIWQNGSAFDCYILKNWREALGRKNDYSYLDRTIDTNSLARAIKKGVKKIDRKDWKLMMFRFANYREKGLKTNLTALGKEFGINVDYESLHNSLQDIRLNVLVWNKLKYMIEI